MKFEHTSSRAADNAFLQFKAVLANFIKKVGKDDYLRSY